MAAEEKQTNRRRKPELLVPASSLPVLQIAVLYGADAVYIGGESYGLRSQAKNFSHQQMQVGIDFAHAHGVQVDVAVNVLAHNEDLPGVKAYLYELKELKPDALIIADPAIFTMAREICPDIDIHISTQANCTNYETFRYWYQLGASRVVAARELSLTEIKEIRDRIPKDKEIECFIHGAMCISYSGRCLLSNYFSGRDANQGACTHPCRWQYQVMEETRPGEYMPVYEDESGTTIFSSKDLCMIDHIPELMEAGIDSFKIEGRMKTALYVATVARTYRKAIDDYEQDPALYKAHLPWYLDQICDCTFRPFTTGFYFGKPNEESQIYGDRTYEKKYTFLGIAGEEKDGLIRVEQKNKFSVGEEIEIMRPDGENTAATIMRIVSEDGVEQLSAPHARQIVYVELSERANPYDILRRAEPA